MPRSLPSATRVIVTACGRPASTRLSSCPEHASAFIALRHGDFALRTMRFDEVVIPQMTATPEIHLNLYWLVAILRFDRVVILPGGELPTAPREESISADASGLVHQGLVNLVDVPLLFVLLFAARLVTRKRVAARASGKLRVLHIIPSLGLGGAQRQLAEVVNNMPPDRYEIDVLLFAGPADDFSPQWLTRNDVNVTIWAVATIELLGLRNSQALSSTTV